MSTSSSDGAEQKPWPLPEFSLVSHAHHTIQKKTKNKNKTHNGKKAEAEKIEKDYEQAIQKGYQEGLIKAKAEMQSKIEALTALAAEIDNYHHRLDTVFLHNAFVFINMICEKILLDKVNSSESVLANILKKGLDCIDAKAKNLKIVCQEKLYAYLLENGFLEKNKVMTLEKDEKMPDFSFKIESDQQLLEYNLRASFEQLLLESKENFLEKSRAALNLPENGAG